MVYRKREFKFDGFVMKRKFLGYKGGHKKARRNRSGGKQNNSERVLGKQERMSKVDKQRRMLKSLRRLS